MAKRKRPDIIDLMGHKLKEIDISGKIVSKLKIRDISK